MTRMINLTSMISMISMIAHNMTRRSNAGFASAMGIVLAVLLISCGANAQEAPSPAETDVPPGAASLQVSQQGFPESVLGSLRTALGVYEEVRGEMAADRLNGVRAHAARLAEALRLALDDRTGLVEPTPAVIEKTAVSAESIAKAEDLATARIAFGEVSRGVLLLASSDPRLADGWHVFACPMVQTFNKWIQPTEALENPYMGKAMPQCGTSTDWSVAVPASVEGVPKPAQEVVPPGTTQAAKTEPEFKPGIPGMKMVDVRDHKFLWREIKELQSWERSDRISVAEYRSKVIEKTAHFLELDGTTADEFATTASGTATDQSVDTAYRIIREPLLGESDASVRHLH